VGSDLESSYPQRIINLVNNLLPWYKKDFQRSTQLQTLAYGWFQPWHIWC
jgi:hypothetical protein